MNVFKVIGFSHDASGRATFIVRYEVPAGGWLQIVLFLGLVEKGLYTYDSTRAPGDYKSAGSVVRMESDVQTASFYGFNHVPRISTPYLFFHVPLSTCLRISHFPGTYPNGQPFDCEKACWACPTAAPWCRARAATGSSIPSWRMGAWRGAGSEVHTGQTQFRPSAWRVRRHMLSSCGQAKVRSSKKSQGFVSSPSFPSPGRP